jgi:proline dehydrogenase
VAGLFDRVARPAILAASRSRGLRGAAERLPVTRDVVKRFVPGTTVDDAIDAAAVLRDSARFVTVDYLGEDVTDTAAADGTVSAYLDLLAAFARSGGAGGGGEGPWPFEVSLKLSALGQAVPRDGAKIALENARTICSRAHEVGAWVTVDAEDHTTTDSTLSIVRELRTEFPWLGTVLQAYLKRTEGDCREFAASGARIRLCKGAYDEPASVAYRDRNEVTASYLRCLRVLMGGSGYPMVASHDPAIIGAVAAMARETGRGVDDFEYQMLYGIRAAEQLRLVGAGNHMRVYVPFGIEWYGYFVRRLAERPANLTFFLRALAERGHP